MEGFALLVHAAEEEAPGDHEDQEEEEEEAAGQGASSQQTPALSIRVRVLRRAVLGGGQGGHQQPRACKNRDFTIMEKVHTRALF